MQQSHPPVVARDEGAFGRGERHVELTLSVLAVHEQRACDADRHLGCANEVFNIAAQSLRVERVTRKTGEVGPGSC